MKILIDFTQIPLQKVGVGVYAMSLLKEISKIESDASYYVLVLEDDNEVIELLAGSNKFEIIFVNKSFRNFLLRFWLEQLYIPFLMLKFKINVLHSLHYSFPLMPMKVKKVVTLHDMTFFLYPEFHKEIKTHFFRIFIKLSLKFTDKIICVSKSTRADVINYFKIEGDLQEKLTAIPLGSDFKVDDFDKNNVDVLKTYNLETKGYFLFVGTIEPRKNLKSIIEAYSMLDDRSLDLVIVGKKGWYYDDIFEMVNKLNLENKIVFTGFITETKKKVLIYNSCFFIYPSFYEGFGIPILEAMSFGIPCITSNISSMPEVAGDTAILIDPHNVKEIHDAMFLLMNDIDKRMFLGEKSIEQAKKFTWQEMTSKTVEVYFE